MKSKVITALRLFVFSILILGVVHVIEWAISSSLRMDALYVMSMFSLHPFIAPVLYTVIVVLIVLPFTSERQDKTSRVLARSAATILVIVLCFLVGLAYYQHFHWPEWQPKMD